MTEPLTLPGDIPGLLRRGSPVFDCSTPGGVVLHFGTDDVGASYAMVAEPDEQVYCCPLSDLALDLRDPTGQYHAALWLLERDGCDTSGGARWRFWHGWRGAVLNLEGGGHTVMFATFDDLLSWDVPALADCKTAAEALRCAVLARAGREE